ncbi:MAG TPA: PQQ-binding-like beta-propeller repeat protein [Solirubrobacterales bacterium]|nr:PQQ-binding-like beta-propeller repeat protein [Solirubrobacterales bacterium]
MDRSRIGRRPFLATALVGAAVVAGCGGGNPGTGTESSTTGTQTTSANLTTTAKPRPVKETPYPYFGRVPERTHDSPDAPNPPFKFVWTFWAHQLIEFPPAVSHESMYVLNKGGQLFALRTSDGKVLWERTLGANQTGPAYADGTVFVAQGNGTFTALDARTGKTRWTFHSPTGLQSSPLTAGGKIYFGSQGGLLYALDVGSGKLLWKSDQGAPIKASPALHNGVVYVGDYKGDVHAVSASSGNPMWTTGTNGYPGGGGFYSSPAIAFGHLYEARADGTLIALDLADGHVDWDFLATDDVYASPATSDVKGGGPTVFIGSYDQKLYALDAATGKERWTFNVGGPIPGSPTVMGDTVYTSSFDTSKTTGLEARTGKPIWEWGSAGYEPMISDGRYAFLVGYQTIWAFEPCAMRGKPNPAAIPICALTAELHELGVKKQLAREHPKSSSAHSGAGG